MPLSLAEVVIGAIIELADTVSEVQSIKHAFDDGIKAQKGIDW